MNKAIPLTVVAVLMLVFGCKERGEPLYRGTFAVQNRTEHDLTDVALNGEGYPGSYGNLTRNARAVITYETQDLADGFEVSWENKSSGERHTRQLLLPEAFQLNGEHRLMIEIVSPDQVQVRAAKPAGQ